ncbi:MAG TPA: hypothetical protein VFC63_23705 [Blastocatellia bacterium]|nr:hypothetical protein [Blastocatellia bacterium]
MIKRTLIASFFFLLIVFSSRPAFGCHCLPEPAKTFESQVKREQEQSSVIFAGRVLRITDRGRLSKDRYGCDVVFEVSRSWKGSLKRKFVLQTGYGHADCGYHFVDTQ